MYVCMYVYTHIHARALHIYIYIYISYIKILLDKEVHKR